MVSDLTQIIVHELTSRGFPVLGANSRRPNLQAYCIKGHDVETASLSIRRDDGRFNCFACGIKGHNWNALAKLIGAAELSEDDLPDAFGLLSKDLSPQIAQEAFCMELPWDLTPWEGEWRGLSEKFLRKCEAHRWWDEGARCRRILLPIRWQSELRGWVARRLDDGKEMKYRNAPGMKAQDILYPYDLVYKYLQPELANHTAVLVEGGVDSLRLVYNHIPALAILGTRNYDPINRSWLLNLGVERVIIATDSDSAGKKARYEIEPSLEEWFEVEHFYPPHKDDPGGMPQRFVEKLKKQVFK
jgi:5S rRNA maturation endonuclease (ribonuclease M5)